MLVQPGETIIGRSVKGETVTLAIDNSSLVRIDLLTRRASTIPISGLIPGDDLWGFGQLTDGSMWTLTQRRTLARLASDGRIVERQPLASAALGLFGFGDSLILHSVGMPPPAPALHAGPPGRLADRPFGSLTVRDFPELSASEMWVKNLIDCGSPSASLIPCWFAADARIDRIDVEGNGRLLELPELNPHITPATSSSPESQPQPIRDACLTDTGDLWVLGTEGGDNPPGARKRGWRLHRYSPDGRPLGVIQLTTPARMLLAVLHGEAHLLSTAGSLMTVKVS